MGDNYSGNGMGRKSSESCDLGIPGYDNWRYYSTAKRPKKQVEMKYVADITFHVLGVGFVIGDIIAKVNGYLNALILIILAIYFAVRSYIKLRRDYVALEKEIFEQEQRKLKAKRE